MSWKKIQMFFISLQHRGQKETERERNSFGTVCQLHSQLLTTSTKLKRTTRNSWQSHLTRLQRRLLQCSNRPKNYRFIRLMNSWTKEPCWPFTASFWHPRCRRRPWCRSWRRWRPRACCAARSDRPSRSSQEPPGLRSHQQTELQWIRTRGYPWILE